MTTATKIRKGDTVRDKRTGAVGVVVGVGDYGCNVHNPSKDGVYRTTLYDWPEMDLEVIADGDDPTI